MWSWRVGSIRGIDLKIHVTFPLVLLWAAYQFGSINPGNSAFPLYGAVLVLLLFACVLLHELGHAFVAQYYKIPVVEIILLPIGGLAKLRMLNDDPKEEFFIAGAGPLVNLVISLLLFPPLLWLLYVEYPNVIDQLAGSPRIQAQTILILIVRSMQEISLTGALGWLVYSNIILVLFNLIPAFPMDGGRLFRALLAMFFSYNLATTIAVRLGQLLAVLMAFAGLQAGMMLLIAFFIFISGRSEMQRVALRKVLVRGQVKTYMRHAFHALEPLWSLHSARLLAQQTGHLAFPVFEEGRLLGLLTVEQIHYGSNAHTVGEAMIQEFSILAPERTLYDAQLMLQGKEHFAAAVMEEEILLGILSLEDIERAYQSLHARPVGQVV